MDVSSPPAPTDQGYSVQAWISRWTQDQLRSDGTYRAWVSVEFNPVVPPVGNSARPVWLFSELSTAVKLQDVAHPKVATIRENLKAATVTVLWAHDRIKAQEIWSAIDAADLDKFFPEIWLIKLDRVPGDRRIAGQYWNEFLVDKLATDEFDTLNWS